jgi:hypothetical protein
VVLGCAECLNLPAKEAEVVYVDFLTDQEREGYCDIMEQAKTAAKVRTSSYANSIDNTSQIHVRLCWVMLGNSLRNGLMFGFVMTGFLSV